MIIDSQSIIAYRPSLSTSPPHFCYYKTNILHKLSALFKLSSVKRAILSLSSSVGNSSNVLPNWKMTGRCQQYKVAVPESEP